MTFDYDDGTAHVHVIEVTDAQSAIRAIETIKDQGEGTPQTPDEAGTGTPAHYYRFAEIAAGKTLKQDAGGQWDYDGDPITFSGVLPLATNPRATNYTGSAAEQNDEFNKRYTALLATLHDVFNGDATALTDAVYDAMPSLSAQAAEVTAIAIGGGVHAGPTFEYNA